MYERERFAFLMERLRLFRSYAERVSERIGDLTSYNFHVRKVKNIRGYESCGKVDRESAKRVLE
jgi:hypothetical protein